MTPDLRDEIVKETRRWVACSKRSHETKTWERREFEDFDIQLQASEMHARAFAEMCESERRLIRLVLELEATERRGSAP